MASLCRLQRYALTTCLRSFTRATHHESGTSNVESKDETVGFVGLGNMGSSMAKNLLKNGYKLIVNDVYPEAMEELKQLGAESAESAKSVAEKSKIIVTMLPSSPEVKEVYTGKGGLFEGAQPSTIFIDSSTIEPDVSKDMHKLAASQETIYYDAPVSGGVVAAENGTLTFMVGGQTEFFASVEEVLSFMGKNVIHCGNVGTGQAAKICNNMLLAISMIGTSETMNLGMRLGLDAKLLAKILNSSSGRCWSSEVYNPVPGVVDGVPAGNNYEGGFATQLMAKDLGLAQTAATTTKTATPLGSSAHQIYRVMSHHGYNKMDFGAVIKFLKGEKSG